MKSSVFTKWLARMWFGFLDSRMRAEMAESPAIGIRGTVASSGTRVTSRASASVSVSRLKSRDETRCNRFARDSFSRASRIGVV